MNDVRATLDRVSPRQDWADQNESEPLPALEIWTNFVKLIQSEDIEKTAFRGQVVQRAYECVLCTEVHELLNSAFGVKDGMRLWHALKFVARPIMDCRMLLSIAIRYPQFRDVKIRPVQARPKKALNLNYQLKISEAWARLTYGSAPDSELGVITLFDEQFRRDCAVSRSLHAEMQLFMHYENSAEPTTSSYFGCSKKACLLCDTLPQGFA